MSTTSSSPSGYGTATTFHRFLELPPEIRDIVYGHVLHPALHRTKNRDAYVRYKFDLSLLRTCRLVESEARPIFFKLNRFAIIETPWPQAQEHVEMEGYVPILIRSSAESSKFRHHSLTVAIDAPRYMEYVPPEAIRRMVIHADELPAFAEFWMYQDLTHRDLNQHMRLTLRLRNAHPRPGEDEKTILPKIVQQRLIEPFGLLRHLHDVVIEGEHHPSVARALRTRMALPYRAPEDCLDEAAALKDEGNAELAKGAYHAAIRLYERSFLALHIVVDGRRRSIFGESHFVGEMTRGRFQGQNGSVQRLIMRVRLVANVVYAYLKLEDFEMAKFWGKRTIKLFRSEVDFDDDEDETVVDFPAAHEMGKIYYRTGVAYKQLGNKDKARQLLKVAGNYLPNDPQVRAEYLSVALQLGG